jgi:ribosomal-protein-serine acetyltransferase
VVGERLSLVLWDESRLAEVQALVADSLETLSAFLPWAAEPVDEGSEREALAQSERHWAERLMAGWTVREDDVVLGMIGLHRRGGPDELEIGYWLGDVATGRGVMTEAARMATDVAFDQEGIDAVEIVHDAANLRSAGVPARLGYRRVAAWTSPPQARLESGVKVRWITRREDWLARRASSSVLSAR